MGNKVFRRRHSSFNLVIQAFKRLSNAFIFNFVQWKSSEPNGLWSADRKEAFPPLYVRKQQGRMSLLWD